MTINRHIKHWFRVFSKDFPFCDDCRSLPEYMEISDDTAETFPPEIKNLVHLEDLELPYTSDGSFMQCRVCNAYYWYRSFAPGGSEDAMETVFYETIAKTGLLGVYMELREALMVSEEYYKEYDNNDDRVLYDMYYEKNEALKKEAEKHFRYIDENSETMIKDTIVSLRANASQKDNKYYREDLIPAEKYVAEILVQFIRKTENPVKFMEDIKSLLKHGNKEVVAVLKKHTGS